ncbi:hypothetical protein SY83_08535 [Paenibacillus swuensis]|uniref:Nudix hydrolase domain-containing protein n=1 Tax=Paenibacillus swuensis TaxID=1178515 RepID=A0A172TH84_9BACL|nr:NUDIX domain-containing protein [Paenibacillus swuensis]ANE46316.1 hypothetical protein SY83_08535 [Paenibacillus swuensis]
MDRVLKAYAYITRVHEGRTEVLILKHPEAGNGFQIPKGTVNAGENPEEAVLREMAEETGLSGLKIHSLIGFDQWTDSEGQEQDRYFFHIPIEEERNEWYHLPTGGGKEAGQVFVYFWITRKDEIHLAEGHGDYLDEVLERVVSRA